MSTRFTYQGSAGFRNQGRVDSKEIVARKEAFSLQEKNHFSQVCLQRNSSQRYASANIVTQSQQLSDDDSGDSIMTLDLSPEPAEEVLAVQSRQLKSKIHAAMKIKGGSETMFQVDTGATCNVIRSGELRGTKYENNVTATNQVLKMYNSSPLKPDGKCRVQLTHHKTARNIRWTLL